jgi:hypothetical protein
VKTRANSEAIPYTIFSISVCSSLAPGRFDIIRTQTLLFSRGKIFRRLIYNANTGPFIPLKHERRKLKWLGNHLSHSDVFKWASRSEFMSCAKLVDKRMWSVKHLTIVWVRHTEKSKATP